MPKYVNLWISFLKNLQENDIIIQNNPKFTIESVKIFLFDGTSMMKIVFKWIWRVILKIWHIFGTQL